MKNVAVAFQQQSSRNLSRNSWDLRDLTETPVGMWEPTYDPAVWAAKHELHLFVQNVGQGDAESLEELPPQMISVLEWKGGFNCWAHS